MTGVATVVDFSAGGIVRDPAGRIAVIKTQPGAGSQVWGLPKGHPKKGEATLEAALRETAEETGLMVEPVPDTAPGLIDYWFVDGAGERIHKRVEFYLMRSIGGDITAHDDEVSEVRWVTVDEAMELLTYENEKTMLAELCA